MWHLERVQALILFEMESMDNTMIPSRPVISKVPAGRRCRALASFLAVAGLVAPVAAVGQQADGAKLFQQRCSACHSMDARQKKTGPHLSGVIGRTAGSLEEAAYSEAMRKSGIVWHDVTLDAFLAAPRKVVPGTTMAVGVPDAVHRTAIIAYLKGIR